LKADPLVAARAVIDCLTPSILRQHVIPYLKEGVTPEGLQPDEFVFQGGMAHILPDMSFICDESSRNNKHEEMADTLFNLLGSEPDREPPIDLLDDFMRLFRDQAVMAFFWRRLLEVGARHPKVYADWLYELCVAEPILKSTDTLHELGAFLESAAGLWSDEKRRAVEEAILALTNSKEKAEDGEDWKSRRDRLIARIPQNLLQTDAARKLRAEMEAADAVPDNAPPFSSSAVIRGGPVTDEDWVRRQGAKPEKPENRRLLDLGRSLDKWATEWHNKKPDESARAQITRALTDTYEVLLSAPEADAPVKNTVWTHLASACEAMARARDLADAEFAFCRKTLLQAARLPAKGRSAEDDARYNFPGWGGTAQSEAAIGLIELASRKPDAEMLQMIRTLALERHTNVRSPTIHYLAHLRERSADFFWGLMHDIVEVEQNDQILGALCTQLWPAAAAEPGKAAAILVQLEPKVSGAGPQSSSIRHFVPAVMWLALARNEPRATRICTLWTSDVLSYTSLLSRASLDAMSFITPAIVSDPRRSAEVDRASDWVLEALKAASGGLAQVRAQVSGQPSEEQLRLHREVYSVFEHVVRGVFFESGVFEHRSKDKEPVTVEQQEAYYPAVKPLLESVLDHTEASKGGTLLANVAHYFIQYLNGVLRMDPPGVLRMAARVIANSAAAGYNLDSLAVGEVVKLVETVLADHRETVQGGQGLDDILAILDAFANAGWPDANRLVWRLDDIFR